MGRSEWVSLGEAAAILGVHPATVRHWADDGDLPSRRTPGGHRRFRRADLEQWASARSGSKEVAPDEAQLMMQSALGRARMEVADGQLVGQAWYDRFDEQTRKRHRALGRRLLELLTSYLADPESQALTLAEVRQLGAEYVRLSRSQGLSLTDSVQAFLFFRDLLTDSVIRLAEVLSLHSPPDWGDRLRQVNHITDELLLALVEGYQQAGEAPPEE
jgi:excisionase family DNA binding protein